MHRETLENLCRYPISREIHAHCVGHGGPRGSEHFKNKAERLMATTGHHLVDMMADRHPLGIAGEVTGKSSNTQSAFRQLWSAVCS